VESNKHAWQKGGSKCLVAELFSPPRFALAAKAKGYLGLSFDIQQGYDLLKKDVQKQVNQQLEESRPELLVLCPECKHWGGCYRLNQHKLPMWFQLYNKQIAQKQADFCVEQAKRQLKRGGRVLIEIGTLSKFKEYRNWVVQKGASKGPRGNDLRNYLIVSGAVDAETGVLIPGTNQMRRYRQ
jgi:hypothetical protein